MASSLPRDPAPRPSRRSSDRKRTWAAIAGTLTSAAAARSRAVHVFGMETGIAAARTHKRKMRMAAHLNGSDVVCALEQLRNEARARLDHAFELGTQLRA